MKNNESNKDKNTTSAIDNVYYWAASVKKEFSLILFHILFSLPLSALEHVSCVSQTVCCASQTVCYPSQTVCYSSQTVCYSSQTVSAMAVNFDSRLIFNNLAISAKPCNKEYQMAATDVSQRYKLPLPQV